MSNMASVSRLNLKTVLIISLLLITLIPSQLNIPKVGADGENWLTGWDYRKRIDVNGSSVGSQTDFQIRIRVNSGNGSDSGEYVYLNGSLRSDFGDIRFTSSDGSTLLDYWIEDIRPTEAYLTNFTKSGDNPIIDFDGGNGYWMAGFYNNYDGKIYLLVQETASPSVVVTAWSFDLADWDNNASWTDHGTVLTGTENWEDTHVEPHSVVWETQTMADKREDVGAGLGTRQWRLYYCASNTGSTDYSIGIANASQENPTVWTKYSGNPVYGHGNPTYQNGVSIADPEAFIFNGELWMAVGEYSGGSNIDQWFAYSENGIDTWSETVANLLSYSPVWGTDFQMEDVISWIKGADGGYSYFSQDGETVYEYDGNPVLPLGSGGEFDDTGIAIPTLIKDKDENYLIDETAYLYYFGNPPGDPKLGGAISTTERFSENGIFWVEVDTIPAAPSNGTIYIYYGKADATSLSDGDATFIDFDDFNDESLDVGWTADEDTGAEDVNETGGEIEITHRLNAYAHIEKSMVTDNIIMRTKVMIPAPLIEVSWGLGIGVYFNQYDYARVALLDSAGGPNRIMSFYDEDGTTGITQTGDNVWTENSWVYLRLRVNTTTIYYEYSSDGLSWTNIETRARAGTWTVPTLTIIGHGYEVTGGSYPNADWDNSLASPGVSVTTYADEYFIRKSAISEPSIVEYGSRESAPSTNANPTVTSFIISDLSDGNTVFKTLWYRPVMVVDDSDGLSDIGTSYFSFETDYGWHNVSYNYQTDVYAVDTETGMIMVANGYTESSGTSLTINFYLYLLESIDVKNNVDVYCRVTDDSSGDSDWSLEQSDYFNILDYVEDVGGSGTTTPWTPGETPSEEPQEEWVDTDGDGIPDWDDPDIDGDWVPNEDDPDIDGDGIPNELDPEPFIPYVKPSLPVLISFKTPSGVIINIINPMYYLKPYQKIIIPFIFILLAIILISMYSKQKEAEEKKGKIEPKIRTGGYGKLEELRKRR